MLANVFLLIHIRNFDESVWNIVVEKKQNKSWLYVEKYNIWKSLCYTEQNFYYKWNCLLCVHEGILFWEKEEKAAELINADRSAWYLFHGVSVQV
jgi:hypothetical protein